LIKLFKTSFTRRFQQIGRFEIKAWGIFECRRAVNKKALFKANDNKARITIWDEDSEEEQQGKNLAGALESGYLP
jgi:hypothetical protein